MRSKDMTLRIVGVNDVALYVNPSTSMSSMPSPKVGAVMRVAFPENTMLLVPERALEEVVATLAAIGIEAEALGKGTRNGDRSQREFEDIEQLVLLCDSKPNARWRPVLETWWEVLGD